MPGHLDVADLLDLEDRARGDPGERAQRVEPEVRRWSCRVPLHECCNRYQRAGRVRGRGHESEYRARHRCWSSRSGGRIPACLEPTSLGTRPPPAPPSSTSRRTPSTWTSRPATRPSARPPRSSSPAASPALDLRRPRRRDDPRDHPQRRAARRRRAYADSRIALSGLPAENTLVVKADCTYSHTGEGLHRFVDPADDRVYLYSPVRGARTPAASTPRSSSPTSRRRTPSP